MDRDSVDLDVISACLGALKGNVKRRVVSMGFKRDVDFFVTIRPAKGNGRPFEQITLTRTSADQLLYLYASRSRRRLNDPEHKARGINSLTRFIPKECETISFIQGVLACQFRSFREHIVGRYRIDLYFPEERLAVECDENGHDGYDKDEETRRQDFLTSELGCIWHRFNPDSKDFTLEKTTSDVLNTLMVVRFGSTD